MASTRLEQRAGLSRHRNWFFVALLFIPMLTQSQEPNASVAVVLTDINHARIVNATVALRNSSSAEFTAKSQEDGTYVAVLKPGTYTMEVRSRGFCILRRGGFSLTDRSVVQFESQMWVCPTDIRFVEYAELEQVPRTRLKPLVLYGKEETAGKLMRFTGPYAFDDGTGHRRQYSTIFTFNLVTLSADEIMYDPANRTITATDNVSWRDRSKSGTGRKVKIKLDGSDPEIVPSIE